MRRKHRARSHQPAAAPPGATEPASPLAGQHPGRKVTAHALITAAWFFVHIVVGTVIFAAIGLAAHFLALLTHWLETHGANPYIVQGMQGFEILLFGVDSLCFAVFICKEAYAFIRGG